MEYRRLGTSDLRVSEIALGSWLTFGGGVGREQAVACIDRAFELGINFFDTANVYGRGAAEQFLGEVLNRRPRDSYVLATKLYFPMGDGDRGLSRAQVLKQIDASLLRLQTDYVDLYQCHRYDQATPLEETMDALSEVVRAGKARHLGFSEWSVAQIEAAHALPGVERFASSQPQYSMLWRLPERAVIPYCSEHGISQVVWSPLGQGVLTGKYRAGSPNPVDSRASSDQMGWAMGRFLTDEIFAAVDRLRPIASGTGLTLSQLALAWVLREPNVAAAIVGASRPEQLDENTGASGARLDEATLVAIDAALADVVVDPG
jgi:aryl-alcohol dehydrogenase-like predicted oxidoreductase